MLCTLEAADEVYLHIFVIGCGSAACISTGGTLSVCSTSMTMTCQAEMRDNGKHSVPS